MAFLRVSTARRSGGPWAGPDWLPSRVIKQAAARRRRAEDRRLDYAARRGEREAACQSE